MDSFQDTYQVSMSKQDQINHINSPISPEKIEAVMNSFPSKKGPGPNGFSGEFYQIFKEELILILFKRFHEIETQGALLNSFYEATITLIPKPNQKY